MGKRTRSILVGGALVLGGLGGAAVVAGSAGAQGHQLPDADDSNEGPDIPITGADLERASAVALDFTGGGRVTDSEVEDEESYYEVEVTLDDGSEIDVQLDEEFLVVGTD